MILFAVVLLGAITAVIVSLEKRRAVKQKARDDAEWLAKANEWNRPSSS